MDVQQTWCDSFSKAFFEIQSVEHREADTKIVNDIVWILFVV